MGRPERVDLAELPPALTVAQVAPLLNVNTSTLYDAIAAGEAPFPVLKLGRAIRIPRAAVLRALALDDGEG